MNSRKTMARVYWDAQRSCGLKVGDWVKVFRKAESYEAGWRGIWVPDMDQFVGQSRKVVEISGMGILLENKNGGKFSLQRGEEFYFPYFVLEKVGNPAHEFKPFERVLVRDYDSEIWRCNLFSHMGDDYYICVFSYYKQCIPYKGNEHLCGTRDMPEE